MFKSSRTAFSLIEVSAVIVIIGILISGVVVANQLIDKFRLSTARTLAISSPITGIKNNVLWLETSLSGSIREGEDADGTPLSVWNDQSTSTNKSAVVAVGTGPTYANTINRVHAVKFSGSTANYMQISDASFLNGTDYTIMVLEKRQSNSSNNFFLGENPSGTANQNLALGYSADSTVIHSQGSASYTSTVSAYSSSTDKPRLFTFTHSSVDGNKTYINGILAAQDSSKTAHLSGITNLAIGKNYTGEIGEIAVFLRSLKNEERQAVEDYASKKWNRKNNRDFIPNATACVGYTITDSGCDLSASPCSISISGLNATVSPTSSSTPISCNQTNYSGSVNYTCVNGTPSVSGSCSVVLPCSVNATGVTAPINANSGATGSASCDVAGYAGTASFTCNNGIPTYTSQCICDTANNYQSISGSCVKTCPVPANSGTSLAYVQTGTTSTACNVAGYSGTLQYTCNASGTLNITTPCAQACTVSGGPASVSADTSSVSGFTLFKFSSVGSYTLTCPSSRSAQVLVVGGGGGGSSDVGGGGGGGQVVETSMTIVGGTTTITVGAGGGRGYNRVSNSTCSGNTGGTSSISNSSGTINALGGSGARGRSGGWNNALAGSGFTGGGAAYPDGTSVGSTGTGGAGYKGGDSSSSGGGGGGGGAGGAGQSRPTGGNGGPGISSSIAGSPICYGGGGGGSGYGGAAGTATCGGGGGTNNTTDGSAGTNGLGGGGGGAGSNGSATGGGGNGGSGFVVIKY